MESGENVPLVAEETESSIISENLKIAEMLELCFQPETKEELDNILLNFRKKIKDSRVNEYFCRFDYVCMYVLDYVYKHDIASFCTVSRSLFLYQEQYQLVLKGKDRNLVFNCNNECFLKELRQFTSLHTYSKKEEMLVDVGLGTILSGNVGLALYLVKFGLIEFPSEVNERCRKMFEILVGMFNSCSKSLNVNMQADNSPTSIQLDELLNQMKGKEIHIRRSIFIFCILVVVAEYEMYQEIEVLLPSLKGFTAHKKDLCMQKLKCIDLFIQATTETIITFKDIENFTEIFLNPFLSAEIGKSLIKTSVKVLGEEHNYYKPRSLNDLARINVRSNLRNSMSIPEQVNELKIPVCIKEFLNFHTKGIWELLVINHLNLSFEQKLNQRVPETEDRNEQAIENRGVQEPEDGNEREPEDGNVREPEDGNEREPEDGNVRTLEDGNVRTLKDGNERTLEDGNERTLEDGNEREPDDGSEPELEDGNVNEFEYGNELEDGNVKKLKDGSVQELEVGNLCEINDGNTREIKDGYFQGLEGGNLPAKQDANMQK